MFAASLQNNSLIVNQRGGRLQDIYFRWTVHPGRWLHWERYCHQTLKRQQPTGSDEQRKRQSDWQATVKDNTLPGNLLRLSTSTNPSEPRRPIPLLTPMDKHIWQLRCTKVHSDSPNQPLDIHCAALLFSHSDTGGRGKKGGKKDGTGR